MSFANKLLLIHLLFFVTLSASSLNVYSATPDGTLTTVQNNAFEGKLTISRYAVNSDGNEQRVSRTPLVIHRHYILLEKSENGSVELIGNIKAESILVRQISEDFVFFTDDKQAVTMNKQELQQMINMLESMRNANTGQPAGSPEITSQETSERKTVQGYSAQKWIVKADNSASEWHVWVTEDLSIPWGMLSESWLTRHTLFSGLPTTEWLQQNRLPIQAELWNGGQLAEILKIEDISPQSISQSHFRIPDGFQRVSFQQMLFNRMRNR